MKKIERYESCGKCFSLIVPTRHRTDKLQSLFDSLLATTDDISRLDIVLVVDADDPVSMAFKHATLPAARVVVPPGKNMGELNMAGYERASGRYVMLLNDDVVVRTKGWDAKVLEAFKSFSDEIALVHVNDRIFEDKLCTFPFVSKAYCALAGGICPPEYVRYRIDDHIYNVFNLLSVLGKNRIIYLPDVVFEHTNCVVTSTGKVDYRPDPAIHQIDTTTFDNLLPNRKELAVQLAGEIDNHLLQQVPAVRRNVLKPITDSVSLRRAEYVRTYSSVVPLQSSSTRVTIGIVSADLRSSHASASINAVKRYTTNYDLVILDNNRGRNFNHSREMNRIISVCKTDYLVLMDDDVYVEPGWLDGMLRAMTPSVGVVTPLHKNADGRLSYAGVVMRPDYSGHHAHALAVPDAPIPIQTLCSAVVLIDMAKCGHIRFDECYSKYFLDIDYGLRIWESGFQVVCTPYAIVTHIGGGTLQQGGAVSNQLFEEQRRHYVETWIETGRYQTVERDRWHRFTELQKLSDVGKQVDRLLQDRQGDNKAFFRRSLQYFKSLSDYPSLYNYARERVWQFVGDKRPQFHDADGGRLAFLLGLSGHPILIEAGCKGFNIILFQCLFYAIPANEGAFDPDRIEHRRYTRFYSGDDVETVKAQVNGEQSPTGSVLETRSKIHLWGDRLIELARVGRDGWIVLRAEKSRFGRWRPAVRHAGKMVAKRAGLVMLGTQRFDEYKAKWKRGCQGNVPTLALGLKLAGAALYEALKREHLCSPGSVLTAQRRNGSETSLLGSWRSAPSANSLTWVRSSPVVLVDEFGGYRIYRFEYKYFAILESDGPFDYKRFARRQYHQFIIGHTLSEVREVIAERAVTRKPRGGRVLLAYLPVSHVRPYATEHITDAGFVLVSPGEESKWVGFNVIAVDHDRLCEWASSLPEGKIKDCLRSGVIVPWTDPVSWTNNALEASCATLTSQMDVLGPDGRRSTYRGENLHRAVYNKACLASMFEAVGQPKAQTVLEVGCSDGLLCEMLIIAGAKKVVGIDIMRSVGCRFTDEQARYKIMDATALGFKDAIFDLTCSIATFEHLPDPYSALLEMLRVTKVGGYCYVQAGPLYHSPYGHHMSAYFRDYPWIHLRMDKEQLKRYVRERGVDKLIKQDLGISSDDYIDSMLCRDHVNGLFLWEYGLEEFKRRNDIRVIKFQISYEGRDLLTPPTVDELATFDRETLVEHGFEIAFQRTT